MVGDGVEQEDLKVMWQGIQILRVVGVVFFVLYF